MCNPIFALFFLSPLTEHTNASLTLSFSLPLEFFLSYSFAHSHHRILLLILITEFFCSFSSPREIKCDRFGSFAVSVRRMDQLTDGTFSIDRRWG